MCQSILTSSVPFRRVPRNPRQRAEASPAARCVVATRQSPGVTHQSSVTKTYPLWTGHCLSDHKSRLLDPLHRGQTA